VPRPKLKGLKFLIDVGVSKKVEKWFLNRGYDIKSVRDIDPRMPDKEVLKIAVSEKRMVVTMDKDFGELVYHSALPHGGVLLLRLEEAKSDEKVKVVEQILEEHSDKLPNSFCAFKGGRLRVKNKTALA
jgi:predicted nuclease of predicted toxin-antitoxin system